MHIHQILATVILLAVATQGGCTDDGGTDGSADDSALPDTGAADTGGGDTGGEHPTTGTFDFSGPFEFDSGTAIADAILTSDVTTGDFWGSLAGLWGVMVEQGCPGTYEDGGAGVFNLTLDGDCVQQVALEFGTIEVITSGSIMEENNVTELGDDPNFYSSTMVCDGFRADFVTDGEVWKDAWYYCDGEFSGDDGPNSAANGILGYSREDKISSYFSVLSRNYFPASWDEEEGRAVKYTGFQALSADRVVEISGKVALDHHGEFEIVAGKVDLNEITADFELAGAEDLSATIDYDHNCAVWTANGSEPAGVGLASGILGDCP